MANIQKLNANYFVDGTTALNAANLNPVIAKINEIIEKVNGDSPSPTPSVTAPTIYVRDLAVIMTAESGATIYYTTDGSTPTSSSTPYTNAFTYGSNCPIKAIAVKNGVSSSVSSASFTYNDDTGNDARQPQIVIENKKLIAISNGLEAQLKYSIDGATYVNYTEPVDLTGACNIHLRTYTTSPETGTATITRTAGINFDNSNNTYVTIPHEGTASRRITAADSDDTQLSMHASSGCAFAIFPIISGKSYLFEAVNNDTASAYYGYINEIPADLTVSTIVGKMPSQPTVTAETLQTINITAENYAYILCCAKGIGTGGDTYANNPLGFTFAEIIG